MCINCAKKSKKWGFPGVSATFSTLVTQIDSISHMMVVLNVSQHVVVVIGHARSINYAKCAKIVQKIAKNEVSGPYLKFGQSIRHDIAYFDSAKCS